jgi:cytochrome c-type biogenesis protein CcmE
VKARHRRFVWIAAGILLLVAATALVLKAFRASLVVFHTPSEVAENKVPHDRAIRLGGLVVADSLKRQADGLTVRFAVTDTVRTVAVRYTGILPDLFKEGKGVVVQGKLGAEGEFIASEVLAKHDENYMAPEAAEALRKAGHPIKGEIFAGQKPLVTQAPEKKQ